MVSPEFTICVVRYLVLLLVTTARNTWQINKSLFCHFSDCILGDSAFHAIIGFEPIGKLLGAFARIAREATPSVVSLK